MTRRTIAAEKHRDIASEARRLAASGCYATLLGVEQACIEQGIAPHDVRAVFDDDPAFQEEVSALAWKARGVGGRATG